MLIFFCLATILIFPSAIGSPQTLPDDDYNPNPDTDSEEYDGENEGNSWKQPVESKIKTFWGITSYFDQILSTISGYC